MEPNDCYFCGKDFVAVNFLEKDDCYTVFCQVCFATGPVGSTEERAVLAWNAAAIPLPG